MRDEYDTLIQEELKGDPWRMLVACILLNKTRGEQVRKILPILFERCPTPSAMREVPISQLRLIISGLGLENRRSFILKAFSIAWLGRLREPGVFTPAGLPGIGKYAMDSWCIFIQGESDVNPEDKELRKFLNTNVFSRDKM